MSESEEMIRWRSRVIRACTSLLWWRPNGTVLSRRGCLSGSQTISEAVSTHQPVWCCKKNTKHFSPGLLLILFSATFIFPGTNINTANPAEGGKSHAFTFHIHPSTGRWAKDERTSLWTRRTQPRLTATLCIVDIRTVCQPPMEKLWRSSVILTACNSHACPLGGRCDGWISCWFKTCRDAKVAKECRRYTMLCSRSCFFSFLEKEAVTFVAWTPRKKSWENEEQTDGRQKNQERLWIRSWTTVPAA